MKELKMAFDRFKLTPDQEEAVTVIAREMSQPVNITTQYGVVIGESLPRVLDALNRRFCRTFTIRSPYTTVEDLVNQVG